MVTRLTVSENDEIDEILGQPLFCPFACGRMRYPIKNELEDKKKQKVSDCHMFLSVSFRSGELVLDKAHVHL